jgi:HK97 family phage major capsid protein
MDKQTVEKILGTLDTVSKGVEAMKVEVASTKEGLTALKTDVEKRLAEDRMPLRVDDLGTPILGAPAVIKGEMGSGHRPLRIINIVKAMINKDWGFAKEERDVSDRLVAAGYFKAHDGGVLFPFAPHHIPDEHKSLREEVLKRLPVYVDPGEFAHHLKQHPAIAKAYGLVEKDLKLGDDTLGGYLVQTTQRDSVIDLMRNMVVMQRAGAQEIPLPPSGNTTWPKLASDPTFAWGDPDRSSAIGVSNITFDVLRLRGKQMIGAMALPNDLIRYSSPSVELIARTSLASAAAVAEDLAWLEGAGTDLEPKGLTNYPFSVAETPTRGSITLHVAGTVGGSGNTFTPEDVATMMALYEESNDPSQATAWIMRPRMWSSIKNRRADAVTANDAKGPFLFPVSRGDMGRAPERRLDDVPVLTTLQAQRDRVKVATNLVYILVGNFSRWIIARSGALELAASEHVRFLQDQTVLKAILRGDAGPSHESSFCITDTLLQS